VNITQHKPLHNFIFSIPMSFFSGKRRWQVCNSSWS